MEEEEPKRVITREQILAGCVCFILLERVNPRDHVGWEGYGQLKSRASTMMGLDGGKRADELVEELLDMFEYDHLRYDQNREDKHGS